MIIEVDNHTHLLFLDCVRFDVRAHIVVAIKLYAKLEYIPHDSSAVPASDDRPIACVLLRPNVCDAHNITNSP